MKLFVLSVFLLLVFSCSTAQKPYELRIKDCKEIHQTAINDMMQKAKQGLPTGPVLTSRDCLKELSLPKGLEIISTTGEIIARHDLKGKRSVINFWFSSCPPCIAEIPMFNQLVDSYKEGEVNFISIGKDPETEVESFLKKYEWNFTHASNGMYLDEDVFKLFFGYPLTIVVDENLVIKEVLPFFKEEQLKSGEALRISKKLIDSI